MLTAAGRNCNSDNHFAKNMKMLKKGFYFNHSTSSVAGYPVCCAVFLSSRSGFKIFVIEEMVHETTGPDAICHFSSYTLPLRFDASLCSVL